jgi:glycosyltransferase involved in cell wall biosynthesis
MSYHANVAGALYFCRQVLPRIWDQDPGVRFQIVGKDPPEAVRQLAADERVQVTGYVDDLRPFLGQATVAICPVPYAAGVQFKVLEAMAMGAPVVCTCAAFEGLKAHPEEEVLVADSPDSFADHILRVCSTPAMAERLAAAGRQYVEAYHSWKASARRLAEVYEQAISDRK